MNFTMFVLMGLIILIILVVISNIKVVSQASSYVVERLGAYHATWGTGLHAKVPFIDRIAKRVLNKIAAILSLINVLIMHCTNLYSRVHYYIFLRVYIRKIGDIKFKLIVI